ncbi:MAG TPA: DUF3592 domain-containing protein [Gammaproteobacteria bacterium]|nr:DUF3592 domain-containing protein [Gammaproteobacteria bacterium]
MATKTGARAAGGCLALFALPFAAVGLGALYFALADVWTWARMSGWEAAPAQLASLDLAEHSNDGTTTYRVLASYRYSYAGRDYASDRAAIDRMADNIGSFQRDLYADLQAAQRRGGRVTAYIDPSDPASATLNRDLRWPLLAFESVFALAFGGIGFALLIGGRFGSKKLAAARALEALYPNEPWRWRAEWADGQLRSSGRATAYVAVAFAALWNTIAIPTGFLVLPEIARGNYAALVGLLFPLAGAGLVVWAVRAWLRAARFKGATLVLQRVPVALGGRLRGTIHVDAQVPATELRVEVSCVEKRSGRNRESMERIVWQNRWTVPRDRCEITPTYSAIPLDLPLPADAPATSATDGADTVEWRLDASAECEGPDLWLRFELPVFAAGERSPALEPLTPAAGEAAARERPDTRTLASLGILYERSPGGGESWTFRRGQQKSAAATVTAIAAVFGAAALALWWIPDAPKILALVFTGFDALFVWFAAGLWFTEYRVTLERGLLTVSKRGVVGARPPVQIPLQWIKSIRARGGMQAGNKLYYDLRVETADDSVTAATSIPDYSVATWLARYWSSGGAALNTAPLALDGDRPA